jgi:hypothetical protein
VVTELVEVRVLVLLPLKICQFFVQKKIYHIFATSKVLRSFKYAGIAQLVEHDLAKVGVASSSLVSRSVMKKSPAGIFYCQDCPDGGMPACR